jgi:CheY-like chemotaxis protein
MGPYLETLGEDDEDGKIERKQKVYRILVVDDSLMNRKMLCKLLISCGHTCIQAVDGLDAIKKVQDNTDFVPVPFTPFHNPTPGDSESSKSAQLRKLSIESPSTEAEEDQRITPRMLMGFEDPVPLPPASPATVERANYISSASFCSFDAILMDFMMPNMDGPTATRAIREMGYMGPIVGVTGRTLTLECSSLGAFAVLPFMCLDIGSSPFHRLDGLYSLPLDIMIH